jgi:ABC-2 type transport system permease protein
MWREVFAFFKKDMRRLWRNKSSWSIWIGLPLALTLILGFVFGQETVWKVDVGIVNHDTSTFEPYGNISRAFIEAMNETDVFRPVYIYETVDEAVEQLKKGKLDAVVVIHENFTLNIVTVRQANITFYLDKTDPNKSMLVSGALNSFLNEFSRVVTQERIKFIEPYLEPLPEIAPINATLVVDAMWALSEPVGVKSVDVSVRRYTYVEWLLPGTVGLVALWSGFNWSAAVIAGERERGTLRRTLISPASGWCLLVGEMLTSVARVSVGVLVVVVVDVLVFGAYNLNWAPEITIPLVFLAAINASSLGLIFSVVGRTGESAQGMAMVFALPFQFFIGSFLPEHMLGPIQPFLKHFPLTVANAAVRKVMTYGATYLEILPLIAYLSAWTIAFLAIGTYLYKITQKRYI